jgi:hypothetical protein
MKFLESITWLDNDVLIPIANIQHIVMKAKDNGGYQITIKGQGELEWEEHFKNEKDARTRYEMIKEIIEAK